MQTDIRNSITGCILLVTIFAGPSVEGGPVMRVGYRFVKKLRGRRDDHTRPGYQITFSSATTAHYELS